MKKLITIAITIIAVSFVIEYAISVNSNNKINVNVNNCVNTTVIVNR